MASNPLVRILVKALRDAGNANGTPIAGYLSAGNQIAYYDWRARDVHKIIQEALAQCPKDALDES